MEERPIVAHKSWPATVTMPDGGVLTPAMVIATRERLYVWTERGEPAVAYPLGELSVRGTFAPPSVPHRATVSVGDQVETVTWVAAQGCGCSHDLNRYNPLASSGPRRLG